MRLASSFFCLCQVNVLQTTVKVFPSLRRHRAGSQMRWHCSRKTRAHIPPVQAHCAVWQASPALSVPGLAPPRPPPTTSLPKSAASQAGGRVKASPASGGRWWVVVGSVSCFLAPSLLVELKASFGPGTLQGVEDSLP